LNHFLWTKFSPKATLYKSWKTHCNFWFYIFISICSSCTKK